MMNNYILFKKDIWRMDAHTFSKDFFQKKVSVSRNDGNTINGIVVEFGLSANLNVDLCERLPVSLKVDDTNISLTNIEQIEIVW